MALCGAGRSIVFVDGQRQETTIVDNKYKISLWSGGKIVESWLSPIAPEPLPNGGGYRFRNSNGLLVEIVGTISVEEGQWVYEELGPRV